jgi:hypothetical protein
MSTDRQRCDQGERAGNAPFDRLITDGAGGDAPADDAVVANEIWSQPDSIEVRVYGPNDFKVASASTVWAVDGLLRGIFRLSPPQGRYGVVGWGDREPRQVVDPVRIAVAPDVGVFAFDDSTRMVDLFTPDGVHIRGFEAGFRPSVMEITRDPLKLTFAIASRANDSVPRLVVIQTDLMGSGRDTLLGPANGPRTLAGVPAIPGQISIAPAKSGLWIWPRTVSDTLFEVSSGSRHRRLVLRPEDANAVGILSDLPEGIVWAVAPTDSTGFRYSAYDVSGSGVIQGEEVYLGERVTPDGFTPHAALAGAVFGWKRPEQGQGNLAASFDMYLERLRAQAGRSGSRSRP